MRSPEGVRLPRNSLMLAPTVGWDISVEFPALPWGAKIPGSTLTIPKKLWLGSKETLRPWLGVSYEVQPTKAADAIKLAKANCFIVG